MAKRMLDFRYEKGSVKASMNNARFRRQYAKAQSRLDGQIMTDMAPYMPMRTGAFIQATKAGSKSMQGSGYVMAAAPPYGYFLYWGKVMADPETGSAWARSGAKKVVTDEDLVYGKSGARAKWFTAAKQQNLNRWLSLAKGTAGGGAK